MTSPFNIFLALITLLQLIAADESHGLPAIKRTEFPNPLSEVQYFDDSDVVLVTDETLSQSSRVWRSTDAGASWKIIEELESGRVAALIMNPHDPKVAVAMSITKNVHWITKDRGEKWESFELPEEGVPSFRSAPLISFHADDSNKMIVNTRGAPHKAQAIYTEDGFKNMKVLRPDTLRCLWAKEQPRFPQNSGVNVNKDRILCVATGKYSHDTDKQRLLISDNFFKDEHEPELEDGRAVPGVVSVVAARGFVLAARQARGTNEMSLYVTTDTNKWHRASFGDHQLKEGGYTIMDSTNYSLQVDVRINSPQLQPLGSLFTSNSHGYNFVRNEEATNRNSLGYVDFEKVTNIQGIVLVNIVTNVKDVTEAGDTKRLKSQISFDDGRTFQDLKVKDGDKERSLQLHSVTEANNVGSVFSSPAPGMLMGIGTISETVRPSDEGDLFVSDAAGRTWTRGLPGPHKYEFGDQGSLLVAVYDRAPIDKISYSTNHGQSFNPVFMKDVGLPEPYDFRVKSLTTHPDSTTSKFIMKAVASDGGTSKNYIYSIDFKKLDMRECKEDDFERWNAVVDQDDKPVCVMGHKQSFRRRKRNADCLVGVKFKDPMPVHDSEGCTCTIKDYECDAQFKRSADRKECIPELPLQAPPDKCKGDDKTFTATNGFRRIPGNECKPDNKNPIEGIKEYECSGGSSKAPNNGEIRTEYTAFKADRFREYYYLERPETSNDIFGFPDETIVAGMDSQTWITHDHGKQWARILEGEEIKSIYPHRYRNDYVYFIGTHRRVHYSTTRGSKLEHFEAPGPPVPLDKRLQILRFHPKNEDWLIWTTCADPKDVRCRAQSHVTTKQGDQWESMLKDVGDCEFVWREGRKTHEQQVYCAQHVEGEATPRTQLVSSEDWFATKQYPFGNVVNFATMSEYIVVAEKIDKDSPYLKIDASIDGVKFADARFPTNLANSSSAAYTVLDSSTHSIFLHVTVNGKAGQEYGTIIKSNSNGTSYTLSLSDVNRNEAGYVDFEKISSMEGVAIANVVANTEAIDDGSMSKEIQSRITHNDGAQWDIIEPPKKDADGKDYECVKRGIKKEECSLHLHSYTERIDPRDTFGSASAVGFIMGVGNVGYSLTRKAEANTFISSDGGITWRTAMNGPYQWEYGDQGGIVVIVSERGTPTNVVYYTRDEGITWTEYKFLDHEMDVWDITTVPSDTSMNFLLWGSDHGNAVTVNIDFSGLGTGSCGTLDPDTKNSNYTTFVPKHPHQDNHCLFGHKYQYWRKKPGATCVNGNLFADNGLSRIEVQNCTCTRADFECNYNYERDHNGNCNLVADHKPLSKEEWCKQNPKADTWFSDVAYRRIPLTTCMGGKELDVSAKTEPCPGHEGEYNKKHGISGVGLFFAIVVPIAAAAAVGWWVYTRFEGRFGLGQIRLGDSGSALRSAATGGRGGDWTKYPVMIISGAAAVAMVAPMLLLSLFRNIKERTPWRSRGYGYQPYTSRGSFSRGNRDYVSVGGQDERDLLGEDSDEDV